MIGPSCKALQESSASAPRPNRHFTKLGIPSAPAIPAQPTNPHSSAHHTSDLHRTVAANHTKKNDERVEKAWEDVKAGRLMVFYSYRYGLTFFGYARKAHMGMGYPYADTGKLTLATYLGLRGKLYQKQSDSDEFLHQQLDGWTTHSPLHASDVLARFSIATPDSFEIHDPDRGHEYAPHAPAHYSGNGHVHEQDTHTSWQAGGHITYHASADHDPWGHLGSLGAGHGHNPFWWLSHFATGHGNHPEVEGAAHGHGGSHGHCHPYDPGNHHSDYSHAETHDSFAHIRHLGAAHAHDPLWELLHFAHRYVAHPHVVELHVAHVIENAHEVTAHEDGVRIEGLHTVHETDESHMLDNHDTKRTRVAKHTGRPHASESNLEEVRHSEVTEGINRHDAPYAHRAKAVAVHTETAHIHQETELVPERMDAQELHAEQKESNGHTSNRSPIHHDAIHGITSTPLSLIIRTEKEGTQIARIIGSAANPENPKS